MPLYTINKHTLQKNLYLCMNNKKSINIYMGIIGEAYVDKETAYAVLLAAKKNILDVQAIIDFANNYEVSNTGFVRNKKTKYILKGRETLNGYLQVSLKISYEIVILPFTIFLTNKVSNYEYNFLQK